MAKIFYIRTMVTIILIIFANIRWICAVLCYLIFGCEIECNQFCCVSVKMLKDIAMSEQIRSKNGVALKYSTII